MVDSWHKISIALLLMSALVSAELQCNSFGRREECSRQSTYPCQWTGSSCEFQYGELVFTCSDVPLGSDVAVTCTPSDSEKEYSVRILDTHDYRKHWYWKPDYQCVNRDCSTWITGEFSWQSSTDSRYEHLRFATRYGDDGGGSHAHPHDPLAEPFSGGDMEYRVVVSMRDHSTCLDISCDVVFSDPSV